MVSGGPPIFSESEAIFTASVIERDKVKKGGVVERDGRSASGKNIGTVVENGVGMGILVAWYCWPVVTFEGPGGIQISTAAWKSSGWNSENGWFVNGISFFQRGHFFTFPSWVNHPFFN